MAKVPTSLHETQRPAEFRQLNILLTTPEESFDAVAQGVAGEGHVEGRIHDDIAHLCIESI